MAVDNDKFLLIDLKDNSDILVSNLGNRGRYLTYDECLIIQSKIESTKTFAFRNDVEELNKELTKKEGK